MSITIAEMLLKQMEESDVTSTYYRGQKITRFYLRRVMWRANCYEEQRQAMKQAGRVIAI